jgi:flagellar protein FliS
MSTSLQNNYLESRVLTAPSHSLHLMLVEGAIRFGRQADTAYRRGDVEEADVPLMRMLDVVGEMLAGVREMKTEINPQIVNLYLYLFRIVGEAKIYDDVIKLDEALTLLEFERETWQLVCEKLGNSPTPAEAPKPEAPKRGASIVSTFDGGSANASQGFSFEA